MILHLQHKKRILAILIALLMGTGSAWAYDFSAVCPSGQTLYYNITDATNHYVALVSPNNYNPYWSTQPTGNLTIPETVTFDNQTFTVTTIGNFAFFYCNGLTGSLTIPNLPFGKYTVTETRQDETTPDGYTFLAQMGQHGEYPGMGDRVDGDAYLVLRGLQSGDDLITI